MKQNMTVITFDIVSDQNRVFEFGQEIQKSKTASTSLPPLWSTYAIMEGDSCCVCSNSRDFLARKDILAE
jgi:hypothetical protein